VPGRVFLGATIAELAGHFGADAKGFVEQGTQAEKAPGDSLVAVVAGRRLVAMRWGLIPMGRTNARGRPVLETLVNARAETLFSKSAFAGLARAILPIGGWFEWTGPPRRRRRWTIRARAEPILAVAAVWDLWRAPGGAGVASLALVTSAPNAEVAPVHDRMPAILDRDAWPLWLGETDGDPAALLRPWGEGRLVAEPEIQGAQS
jgi:putative SOS response-associated peptidase YedK